MKNYKLELLAIIIGLLLAAAFPIASAMPSEALLYYIIMVGFSFLVLAFMFLSYAKLRIARIDYARAKEMFSWSLPNEPTSETMSPNMIRIIISATFGILLCSAMLLLTDIPPLQSILAAGILTVFCIGIWGISSKRIAYKTATLPDFMLSHNALVFLKKITFLDGTKNAIYETALNGDFLKLGLKQGRKTLKLSIPVPTDKKNDVQTFLSELEQHFATQMEEKSNARK